jgi:hypothetical protein
VLLALNSGATSEKATEQKQDKTMEFIADTLTQCQQDVLSICKEFDMMPEKHGAESIVKKAVMTITTLEELVQ